MNSGYVRFWRKVLDSGMLKNHKLWVFWSWCLLKASYREYDAIVGLQVVHLMPGQFIFGRRKAASETGLTEREIRTIIELLKKTGNLTIKTTNKFSIITIINWPIYQAKESENDQLDDQPPTSKRPHTRSKELKNKNPREISSQISSLRDRYPDQKIIDQALEDMATTRKTGKVADSVKLSILQSWSQYPVKTVIASIRTYLDKGYAAQGKNERYLLGIIRNLPEGSGEPPKPTAPKVPVLNGFSCPRCGQEVLFETDLTSTGCVFCDSRRAA